MPKGYKTQKTIDKERAREALRAVVVQHMGEMVAAQIENAKGLKFLMVREKATGKFVRVGEAVARLKLGKGEEIIEVWEKDPSVQAFTDLMNRTIDLPAKPPEEHKVDGTLEISWKTED